jgi:hypothetical protein
MVTRVVGSGKNLLLTLWLALPILVVVGLVAVIFAAHARGPAMDARAVGQGAGDTGGANALGEWLAGRDVLAEEGVRRDLREGRLVEVVDWPDGVNFRLEPEFSGNGSSGFPALVLWAGEGTGREAERIAFHLEADGSIVALVSRERLAGVHAEGRPGAGVYFLRSGGFEIAEGGPVDGQGHSLRMVELPPVPADRAIPGQPVDVSLEWDLFEAP